MGLNSFSAASAVINDTTPSNTGLYSSQKVSSDFLNVNSSISGVPVLATISKSGEALEITKVTDTEYIANNPNASWRGILWSYDVTQLSQGLHVFIQIQRATGDTGNVVPMSSYAKDTTGAFETWGGSISIPATVNKIAFERYFSLEYITAHTYEGKFSILLSTNAVSTLDEVIISTVGVSSNEKNIVDFYTSCYAPLVNKKALFLGDSITNYNNDKSWVRDFEALTGIKIIANVAVSQAQLADKEGTVYDGDPKESDATNNVLGNQVQKVINNQYDAPDLIIIAIGTNGGITADDTRCVESYVKNNAVVPLTDLDRTTSEGAFRYCNETLHNLYPHAEIFWCSPIQSAHGVKNFTAGYSSGEALQKLTRYGSSHFVDTYRCGVRIGNEIAYSYGEYLADGLHPNSKGAYKIAFYNANEISNKMRTLSNYKDSLT